MSTPSDTSPQNSTEATVDVAQQFLNKASDYFQSEMKTVSSDYECLSKMNIASLDKYKQMQQTSERVNNAVKTINDSNRSNVLAADKQFQEIEETMSNLESTIKHLDAYSRSLESQVKKFEKMSAANRTKSSKKD